MKNNKKNKAQLELASPNKATNSDYQSDSETVQHTSSNYKQLLQQLKMKSKALTKASNLIEILQLQLQVQKNSRTQAIQTAQQQIRQTYDLQIQKLQQKLKYLESNRKICAMDETGINRASKSRISRTSNSLDRSQYRRQIKNIQYVQKPKINMGIQTQVIHKYLLEKEKWDNNFMSRFKKMQNEQIMQIEKLTNTYEHKMKYFLNEIQNKHKLYEQKIAKITQINDQYLKVIYRQRDIIQGMKTYQKQLEKCIVTCSNKFQKNQNIKSVCKLEQNINWCQQLITECKQSIQMGNKHNKLKIQQLQIENSELREITEQMINLVKAKHF